MNSLRFPLILFVVFLAAASFGAAAQTSGDSPWLLRFGAAYVEPLDDSDGVIGDNGLGLVPGNDGVDVEGALGFAFSLSYSFTPNWAATLLAAAPFGHDLQGTGAISGIDLGKTYHLPPSLTLEYRFNPAGRVTPYIGAGINWTWFYKTRSDPQLTNALNGILGGVTSTDIDLDNSFGIAANLGIDWRINDAWGINTSIWYLDIDTEAEVYVNNALATEVDVDVNPLVFVVGLNYRF